MINVTSTEEHVHIKIEGTVLSLLDELEALLRAVRNENLREMVGDYKSRMVMKALFDASLTDYDDGDQMIERIKGNLEKALKEAAEGVDDGKTVRS